MTSSDDAATLLMAKEGYLVQAFGLSQENLNGLIGSVVKHTYQTTGDRRVVVEFSGNIGRKSLRESNLKIVEDQLVSAFLLNLVGLVSVFGYLMCVIFDPRLALLFWRIALLSNIVYYGRCCYNLRIMHMSLSGINTIAKYGSGQLLILLLAFLFLGDTCYILLIAIGAYNLLTLAAMYKIVTRRAPLFRMVLTNLGKLSDGMLATDESLKHYCTLPSVSAPPPSHPLELAAVCCELFVAVQQVFQSVFSPTKSFVMFVICWRYLAFRYSTPENRVVRTVLNKAREKLDGWMAARFVPSFITEFYHIVADKVWGPVVRP
eukprot:TRINITY_DN15104_c0_g1_i2.p1 TRINITY_DN15104_c0_g1~~TRINITY_DN15104_c0_g1_i2.p1  ORF type:complete len:319 (+),score=22.47 TRINITY_DN15104_c0_g1_i2:47-1003(+)